MEWTITRGVGTRYDDSSICMKLFSLKNCSRHWNPHAPVAYLASMDADSGSSCLGVRSLNADICILNELTGWLRYLIMATLSLYIFNLLPLPWLDGSHFLRTILQMKWSLNNDITTNEYDLEALEFPREQWTRFRGDWWRDQLANIVQKVTIGLFGGCIVLETMKAIF